MREKLDNLWRRLCLPLLLSSTVAVLFGCASRNPLVDEDTPVDDDKAVVSIEADEQKLRDEQAAAERREKELARLEAQRRIDEAQAAERAKAAEQAKEIEQAQPVKQATPVQVEQKAAKKKLPSPKKTAKQASKKTTQQVATPVAATQDKSILRPVDANAQPEHVDAGIPEVKEVNATAATERKPLEIVPEFHAPERRAISYSAYGKSGDHGDDQEVLLNSPPRPVKKWLIFFTPYRVNQQQGNFISAEMLDRLQPGMTKDQVRFALGTPLLMDMFHANRWDYPFRLLKKNGALSTYRVAIFFNQNGVVESVKHDALPSEIEYLEQISSDDDSEEKPKKDDGLASTDRHMTGDFQPGSSPTPIEAGAAGTPSPEELERQLPKIAPVRTTGGDPDVHKPDYVPGRVSKGGQVSRPLPGVKPAVQQTWTPKDAPPLVPEIQGENGPEQVVDYQSLPSYRTGTYGGVQSGVPRPISAFRPSTVQAPVEGAVSEEKRSEWMANRDAMLKALHAYDEVEGDGVKNLTYDSIRKFEAISIPKRTNKMVPESPNLKQIGNIQ